MLILQIWPRKNILAKLDSIFKLFWPWSGISDDGLAERIFRHKFWQIRHLPSKIHALIFPKSLFFKESLILVFSLKKTRRREIGAAPGDWSANSGATRHRLWVQILNERFVQICGHKLWAPQFGPYRDPL